MDEGYFSEGELECEHEEENGYNSDDSGYISDNGQIEDKDVELEDLPDDFIHFLAELDIMFIILGLRGFFFERE